MHKGFHEHGAPPMPEELIDMADGQVEKRTEYIFARPKYLKYIFIFLVLLFIALVSLIMRNREQSKIIQQLNIELENAKITQNQSEDLINTLNHDEYFRKYIKGSWVSYENNPIKVHVTYSALKFKSMAVSSGNSYAYEGFYKIENNKLTFFNTKRKLNDGDFELLEDKVMNLWFINESQLIFEVNKGEFYFRKRLSELDSDGVE
jgi:hypothetical protein